MKPATWRKHFKWRDAALVEEAKKYGVKYFYFHSDGNLTEFFPDLVEIGFNIIDPIQPECMDPNEIKERFGDRVVLHGTVSSQHTLPFGSVEDVRAEVMDRVSRCGYNNGLVIAPNNIVQFDVPLENILAVYDTVKEIGPEFYRASK
jgi:uroporphyrinogen decarboxylase